MSFHGHFFPPLLLLPFFLKIAIYYLLLGQFYLMPFDKLIFLLQQKARLQNDGMTSSRSLKVTIVNSDEPPFLSTMSDDPVFNSTPLQPQALHLPRSGGIT